MARSRALDRWRSLQVRRRVLSEDLPRELPAPEVGPEHSIASSQESARVRSAIAALPEEQRQLILLAFWEGMSHSEVAGRTGLPLGTVKTRIRLGMLKLREALADARPN
jgi:RNA polymerase sigma-70 factor (ECF subfamily)